MHIPFNKPYLTGEEERFVKEAIASRRLCGDNAFTKKCHDFIEQNFGVKKALLTPSGTGALDMAAIMLNLKPGDEIILPSYTFSSTANAVCLRGAKPVFVDIRKDTLNINENKIKEAITEKTKAILPVHYGGIAAEMNKINKIAKRHNLFVVEDAAQGVDAKYNGQYLGSIGNLAAYSFHETKNHTCGEGGAILINDDKFTVRSEILWEKGTDRSKVIRGEKDKYSWVDLGSSFLMSDILAAFLYAQLLHKNDILKLRKTVYERYHERLSELEEEGLIQLPIIPKNCSSNYHSFFILLRTEKALNTFLKEMKKRSISAYIGYVPLHTSKMGLSYGYKEGDLPVTEDVSRTISRLPFYSGMGKEEQTYAIDNMKDVIRKVS